MLVKINLMKTFLFNVFLIIVSSYITLFIVQLLLVNFIKKSEADISYGSKINMDQMCDDDEGISSTFINSMGGGLVRNSSYGWVLNPDTIGNKKGYLGPCYPYYKNENTFRVLMIGDSFTGAIQVSYENTFVSLLEKNYNNLV